MQHLKLLIGVLKNKYILSLIVFAVWMVFFDKNDLFTQADRKRELEKLEMSQTYYLNEIANTKKQLADLENNRKVLEKFAREQFYLKRPNEDLFIVEEDKK